MALSKRERGILELDPLSSWVANTSQLPPATDVSFLRSFSNLGPPSTSGNSGNLTAALWQLPGNDDPTRPSFINPDVNHALLFQEIVQSGGSIAFALQSLLTVVAGIAYYEQLPQFHKVGDAEQVYFVTANIPQHFRGLLTVLIVPIIHLVLTSWIVIMFSGISYYSMLGNSWQSISQARTTETEGYLEMASTMRDKDLKKVMKEDGQDKTRVGLAEIDGQGRVGIVRYRGMDSKGSVDTKSEEERASQETDLEERMLKKRKTE